MRVTRLVTTVVLAGSAVVAAPVSAFAAETESATLTCGSTTYEVTGFGRGQTLHLVGSSRNFVVVFARQEPSGRVIADIPGQRSRADVVECTTTTPSGQAYTLRGFLTPRG